LKKKKEETYSPRRFPEPPFVHGKKKGGSERKDKPWGHCFFTKKENKGEKGGGSFHLTGAGGEEDGTTPGPNTFFGPSKMKRRFLNVEIRSLDKKKGTV